MSNWKWRSLGQDFGPVEITALNELAKNGTLGLDDEVCRGGSEQWQRVAAVPELQKFFTPTSSSAPATSTKSAEPARKAPAITQAAQVEPISKPLEVQSRRHLNLQRHQNQHRRHRPSSPRHRRRLARMFIARRCRHRYEPRSLLPRAFSWSAVWEPAASGTSSCDRS